VCVQDNEDLDTILENRRIVGQNFPDDFDGTLDCMSVAITCQFNRFDLIYSKLHTCIIFSQELT
jgi:hypothetical protein